MRRGLVALLGVGALVLTGCSTPGPPEVTFYADGHTVNAQPLINCDALVRQCDRHDNATVNLKVRPGRPVQVSVPKEIADTPWVANVQYTNEKGEYQPVRQEYFGPGTKYAYTATPAPGATVAVVEIQQLGAAYAADQAGNPILDEAGNPQLVVRSVWSLQVKN